jgi:2,3-dihydroxybenzoate decarboxylase
MEDRNERRSFLKYSLSLSAFIAGSTLSFNKSQGLKAERIKGKEAFAMSSSVGRVKKIAVEEHFLTEEYLAWIESRAAHKPSMDMPPMGTNLGEERLKDMDECGIDMQILSLAEPPGYAPYPCLDPFNTKDAIALAKIVNNELSGVVKRYPEKFAGFCCLPLQDPIAAADELERAVTELGLVGTMVNDTPKRWLSDEKYEVLYERLAKLDVPLYIHAMGPTDEDSGLHVVPEVKRLIQSGIFDKYSGLKIILGHGGESLPFWLHRISGIGMRGGQKSFMQYFKDNFYVTTSAQCWAPLLEFLITVLGADRILFATDYRGHGTNPSTCEHVEFIDSVRISDSDREKICHLNAEKLFRL